MSLVTKSHYQIFDYWRRKCITKDGYVRDVPNQKNGDMIVITDWGEPCCWACNKPIDLDDYAGYEEASKNSDYKRIWEYCDVKSHLDRCHILPEMIGGTDEESNMFLLCKRCHAESPDTRNPRNFFRWVYRKRHNSFLGVDVPERCRQFREEIESRLSMDVIGISQLMDLHGVDIDPKDMTDYVNKNACLHEFGISDSTIIMCAADYIEQKYESILDPNEANQKDVCSV